MTQNDASISPPPVCKTPEDKSPYRPPVTNEKSARRQAYPQNRIPAKPTENTWRGCPPEVKHATVRATKRQIRRLQHEAECNRAGNCGGKSDQQFWLGVERTDREGAAAQQGGTASPRNTHADADRAQPIDAITFRTSAGPDSQSSQTFGRVEQGGGARLDGRANSQDREDECCHSVTASTMSTAQTHWKSCAPHMPLRCSCFPQICKIMKERAGDWRSSSFATWIGESLKGTSLI